jgi:phosphoserine aminotransferase
VREREWLGYLAKDPSSRSKTRVCLTVDGADATQMAKLLDAEGVAYDIAGYRDAPPGLRIWCGATVNSEDIDALGPWLDWAREQVQ